MRQRRFQRGLRRHIGFGEQAAVPLVAVRHLEKTRRDFALRNPPYQGLDLVKHDQVRRQ